MGATTKKIWPLTCIVLLWLVFSFPYFLRGLVPFPSTYLATFFPPWSAHYGMPVKNNAMPDVITQLYPWKKLTIDTWKSGHVPLWNPYSLSGTPHAGNYQTAVFTPFNLLFFVLPFIDAWSMLVLLQPLLAGLFMFAFVRSLGRSQPAALVSAIAFMFCGFIVTWMAYGTLGYAVLWLPVILWGIHTKRLWAVSVGIALSFLAGHFQASLYVLLATLGYVIWNKAYRSVLFVLLGLMIAAPQILLGVHSFLSSTRGLSVLRGEIIPWQYLITLLAPDFFGNPVTRNDWFGHYAEWAGFIGVIPLMLATVAMFGKKTKDIWFFIILGIVSLLFALPTPFNALLYVLKIPILSGSAASRIIILTSFSFAVLAAYGVDQVKWHWKHILGWIGLVGVIWIVLLFGNLLPPDKLDVAKHNFVLPSLLVLSGCVAYFVVRFKKVKPFVLVALIGLTAFDLIRFATKWMPFDPREYVYPQVKSLEYLQTNVGVNRVFGNVGNEVGSMFSLQLVEGYDAVYQGRYGEFISAVSKGFPTPAGRSVVQFDKNGLFKTEALELMGIRYIYHRFSDGNVSWVFPYWEYPGRRQVYTDEVYEVFEFPDVYPRAFLASSYVVSKDDDTIIDTLFSKDFNRRETIVLEQEPSVKPREGSGSAVIESYMPNAVSVITRSNVPKLLFLSDVFDSGWRVTVDGSKAQLLRADYDFRAVALPAGDHTVEFVYAPQELVWGIMLSVLGVVGVLIFSKRS